MTLPHQDNELNRILDEDEAEYLMDDNHDAVRSKTIAKLKAREERLIREARAKQTEVIQKLINEALQGEDIKLDLKIDTVHLTKDEKEVLDDNLLELL